MEKPVWKKKFPNEPWKWREDWANNYSIPLEAQSVQFKFIFIFIWVLITCPISIYALSDIDIQERPILLVVLVFPFLVC